MERLTDLEYLTKEFAHAIKAVEDTDTTGLRSSEGVQRATIVFIDDTRLYVTERLNEGYSYDWVSKDGRLLFHHDNEDKTPNFYHRDPYSIVRGIVTFHLMIGESKEYRV
ncbi:toxin-antitoxin system TumE family protein [Paenibacillus nanensis]|uniref:toxin-antitoxin system TumE family protein n=1 Tax=Paenibacillus nanensis TaxID=393251 RepID=UPI001F0C8F5D|nr:DUF6516 family protein [Paenibacillus nanensis]